MTAETQAGVLGDFRVTMLLCDHVAVAEGKLYVSGGGWTHIGPEPNPFSLAVLVEVPWTKTNQRIALELRLLRGDVEPVQQPGPLGPEPIVVATEFEVGRPVGLTQGVAINVPMAFNFGPLPLPSGERLTWELRLDNRSSADWHVAFETRRAPVLPNA